MVLRYDASRLQKGSRTSQGFLRADARLTRTGVFPYRRADGSIVHELRHPEDVFAPASLATAEAGLPLTLGHHGLISVTNARQHKIGQTVSAARADGSFVATQVQLEDAQALARVDAGVLKDLSAGYEVDIVQESGTYQGQRYDQRQTNIRYNHVALLPPGAGRAGKDVGLRLDSDDAVLADLDVALYTYTMAGKKIRIDSVETDVPEAVAAHIESLENKLAASEKAAGAAAAKVKEATERADAACAPAAIDARVQERVALIDSARKILGDALKPEGKSARQIHELVLSKTGVSTEKRSDAWVEGAFEAACAQSTSVQRVQQVMVPPVPGARTDATDATPVFDLKRIRDEANAAKSKPWKATK